MTNHEDKLYEQGSRAVWLDLFRQCVSHLGYDSVDATPSAWAVEREEAIAALRSLCRESGDNDWEETLHLADIIEKHLARHLPK